MLCHTLESIARHTWETLQDSTKYGISQGEETITDNLLLYLLRQNLPSIHVIKTPKDKEPRMGTDWEWWIGSRSKGFLRYAIQAKKLDYATHRFLKLKHEVRTQFGKEDQEKVLKRYAATNSAIPLYALYNYVELADFNPYWNCQSSLAPEQFGFTVTPLHNIEEALATRGCRSFERLHSCSETIPVRCLAICPGIVPSSSENRLIRIAKLNLDKIKLYSFDDVSPLLSADLRGLEAFPQSLYSSDLGLYPKHIAVAETDA